MRVLVLGGTRFVGRAIVAALLGGGHDVTLFNRGTDTDLFAGVPRILGDRGNPEAMAQIAGDWDAVVDVSAYHPADVRTLLDAVGDDVRHHVFVSTVSVYDDKELTRGADESGPVLRVDESIPSSDPRAYGGLKVLCEEVLRARVGDALTILRPTVVIGPHDYTDRFPFWVRTVAHGGRISAPRHLEQALQLIDAEDMAAFARRALERRVFGTYNIVGPTEGMTFGSMLHTIADAFGAGLELDPVFTEDGTVRLPLALPAGHNDAVFAVAGAAAYAQGLTPRSLRSSALAVLAWERERGPIT